MEQKNEDSVVWDDSYSVGHSGIDYQHKDLVSMTNNLFNTCKGGDKVDRLAYLALLKGVATYAKLHFSDEEKYMAKGNYPKLAEHKKEHEQFVATVTEAIGKFEQDATPPINLARFLKNWLLNHIAKSDKQYAPYVAGLNI